MGASEIAVFYAYEAITAYCSSHGKHLAVRNHADCLYLETLREALSSQERNTPSVVENTESALLTEQAIQGYVARAESFTDGVINAALEPMLREKRHASFWDGVASSILGSFLFSILLLIVFWVGKDQIESWLRAITS